MKFVTTLHSKDLDLNLIPTDAVSVGVKGFSSGFEHTIIVGDNCPEINKILDSGKKVFLHVNKIFHEGELDELEKLISRLTKYEIEKIYFSDFAVLEISKKYNLADKLIYSPDTLITNYEDVNLLHEKMGIKCVTISKEINQDDINKILENTNCEIDMICFGHLKMFQSKRNLVSLFNEASEINLETNSKFLLKEELRDEYYPILEETNNSTHIFTHNIFSIFNTNVKIENIDYLRINTIFLKEEEIYKVTSSIVNNNYEDLESTVENLDTALLKKKTIYKKEVTSNE